MSHIIRMTPESRCNVLITVSNTNKSSKQVTFTSQYTTQMHIAKTSLLTVDNFPFLYILNIFINVLYIHIYILNPKNVAMKNKGGVPC